MKSLSTFPRWAFAIAFVANCAAAAEPQFTRSEAYERVKQSILRQKNSPAEASGKLCLIGNLIELAYTREGVTVMTEAQGSTHINMLLESPQVMHSIMKKCVSKPEDIMDLDQLRTDADELDGKRVTVYGQGQYLLGFFVMKKDIGDMSPILIDMTKVPRAQRLYVIQQCGDARRSCEASVVGVVGKVAFQLGLLADVIIVK